MDNQARKEQRNKLKTKSRKNFSKMNTLRTKFGALRKREKSQIFWGCQSESYVNGLLIDAKRNNRFDPKLLY